MNSGPNWTASPETIQYTPAPAINRPAKPWHIESTFWASIFLSARMPIRVGIKMDTMPCIAKNHLICEPRPMLPR